MGSVHCAGDTHLEELVLDISAFKGGWYSAGSVPGDVFEEEQPPR